MHSLKEIRLYITAAVLALTVAACGSQPSPTLTPTSHPGITLTGRVVSERYTPGVHHFTLQDAKYGNVEIGMEQSVMARLARDFHFSGESAKGSK